jgi:hypothetical protein
MTIQPINIGNIVNDGLGDDLRTAFEKVNANFSELGSSLTVTASNLGGGAVKGIFKEKVGTDLKFKSLTEGNYITLTTNDDVIEISNSMPDSFYKITTDSGIVEAATLSSRGHISFSGTAAPGSTTSRKDIEVTTFGPTVYFKTIIPVTDILTSYDFGTITGNYNNAMQMLHQSSNIDFGTITIPGRLDIDCGSIL